jgi:hypothetical protein
MDNEKKGNLFSNFADGEPLNPGAPGQGSGRVRGRRKEGAGHGDGAADPAQHHGTQEGNGPGPEPGAWVGSAGKKYLFRNLFLLYQMTMTIK